MDILFQLYAVAATVFVLHAGEIPVNGTYVLPAGTVELSEPIVIPKSANGLVITGAPSGTVLKLGDSFNGRAAIVLEGGANIDLRSFTINGNRKKLEVRRGLPPSDRTFAQTFPSNGVLALGVDGLTIAAAKFTEIPSFAVLASNCRNVRVAGIEVNDSGSRNEKGRNNTTGGVLIEDGSEKFTVIGSNFQRISGNAVWTHSRYHHPRNKDGVIEGNTFTEIGRDAIQIGHATRVRVLKNTGTKIGYPNEIIDAEGGGTPVGIDTAGDVDESIYTRNRFEEVNGKCIDLDGFHHGEVSSNTCINNGRAADYPYGHYAIVFNNTNPDMQSMSIRVLNNRIDGTKFGGIFLIGAAHTVRGNTLTRINLSGCNESAAQFGCSHFEGEPDLLQSGIYLGQRAERPAPARGNVIEGNKISGHKMAMRCVGFAPGASKTDNTVRGNTCRNEEPK